jgi:ketosteroid isomerase-like protein
MATADAAVTRTIQALSETFVRVYNSGNLDILVETFYTEDAHLLPPGHPLIRGRSQIRHFFQNLRQAGAGALSAATIQIEVSGDLAYCLGTYAFGTLATNRGKFLEVYRRQADGSWKMVADMFNCDQVSP